MTARKSGFNVDREAARKWLEARFGEVRVQGRNLCVCAPWPSPDGRPDTKFHLSVWPEGNCYHNWRPPNNSGSLVSLVSELDGCSFAEAVQKIGATESEGRVTADAFDAALKRVAEMGTKSLEAKTAIARTAPALLPPTFCLFDDPVANGDPLAKRAAEYVESRGIVAAPFGIGYCRAASGRKSGPRMDGRVVVPYFGRHGGVEYWTARSVDGEEPKYVNPVAGANGCVGKGAVLWCGDWTKRGGDLFVVEGAFDAVSLATAGIHVVAVGGSQVTPEQERLIASFAPARVVLAFDADEAGRRGTATAAKSLKARGLRVGRVEVPDGYKDWNQLWAAWREPEAFAAWAKSQIRGFGTTDEVAARVGAVLRRTLRRPA